MTQKENIEAELDAQVSILKANNSTLHSSLVDKEGFPRADIGGIAFLPLYIAIHSNYSH